MLTGSEIFKFGHISVCLISDDIVTSAPLADVLVNDVWDDLQSGKVMNEWLAKEAGVSVRQECDEYVAKHGPLTPGDCFVSKGGSTIYVHIIHVVAPAFVSDCNGKRFVFQNRLKNTLLNVFRKAVEFCAFGLTLPIFRSDSFLFHCNDICQAYYDAFREFAESITTSYLTWIYIYDDNHCNLQELNKFLHRRVGILNVSQEELEERNKIAKYRRIPAIVGRLAKRNEELALENQKLMEREKVRLGEEYLRLEQDKRERRERELNDSLNCERLMRERFEWDMQRAADEDARFDELFTTNEPKQEIVTIRVLDELGSVKTESFTEDLHTDCKIEDLHIDYTTEDYFGNRTHTEQFKQTTTVTRTESFTNLKDRASRPRKVSIKSSVRGSTSISPRRFLITEGRSPCDQCLICSQNSPCDRKSRCDQRSPRRRRPRASRYSTFGQHPPYSQYSPCSRCSTCRQYSPCDRLLLSPNRSVVSNSPHRLLQTRSRSFSPISPVCQHQFVDQRGPFTARRSVSPQIERERDPSTYMSFYLNNSDFEKNPKVMVPEPPVVQVIPTTTANKTTNKNLMVDDNMGQVYLSKILRCDWAEIELHICQLPHQDADALIMVRDCEFVQDIRKACRCHKMENYEIMPNCNDCNYLIFRLASPQDELKYIVIMAGPVVVDKDSELAEELIVEFREDLKEILKKLIENHQCLTFGLVVDYTVALSRMDYCRRLLNEMAMAAADISKPK